MQFTNTVEEVWGTQVRGAPIFQVVCKPKALKSPLGALNKNHFEEVFKLEFFRLNAGYVMRRSKYIKIQPMWDCTLRKRP